MIQKEAFKVFRTNRNFFTAKLMLLDWLQNSLRIPNQSSKLLRNLGRL